MGEWCLGNERLVGYLSVNARKMGYGKWPISIIRSSFEVIRIRFHKEIDKHILFLIYNQYSRI